MSSPPPRRSGGGSSGRGGSSGSTARSAQGGALGPTLAVLAVLVVLILAGAWAGTEILWYRQLGFDQVLWTEWLTRGVLFLIGFLVAGGLTLAAMLWAYRTRRIRPPTTTEERNVARYRASIEPLRKVLTWGIPAAVGLFAGMSLFPAWRTVLLWLNGGDFGRTDPEFGLDVSFFVFTLPLLDLILGFLLTALVVAALAAVVVQYIYGGISVGPRTLNVSRPARVQLSVLAALIVLLLAVRYWLDRYSLLIGNNERFAGASYTDVEAALPGLAILAVIALLVAAMFVFSAFRGGWKLPVAGVAVMIISALVVGTAYPAIIQRFVVDPNAVERESEYIQRNIDGTHAAYGLEGLESQTYEARTTAEAGQLRDDAESTASIRILDPNIVSPTFNQLQQNRQYYSFPDELAVDRYDLEGENHDTVIGVRELNQDGLGPDQRTWVNDHTVYTHGFGVAAAYGNTVQADGRPEFFQYGIPSTGRLGEYEPRVYFGENSPEYSIVGAPEGSTPWELDYPDDDAPNGQQNYTFTGDGGPKLSNFIAQLMYAVRFGSTQILFSDRVNSESQILYDRDPALRVAKAAPYLTLDGRVYPAVVDMDNDPETPKRLVWIVDGYTTSNNYPYSARESLQEATVTSLGEGASAASAIIPEQVNYIRNSVKAVVDAYDGSVQLYQWDEEDPIVNAWANIFPDHLTPVSEISGDLMSHMRYPQDLFKVQRELLTRYHVTDAASFYSGGDFWNVPSDPTVGEAGTKQPPYYLTLEMPGQEDASFSLTTAYIPGGQTNRNVLTGFLAVDAEAGSEAGQISEDYGKMRLLELPRDLTVPGPGQVQNNFNSNPTVSTELNLLEQGGSQVLRGNLLTLPVGGGLLYVQPVYVQASQGTQYPLLQRVLVAFGEEIGFAPTLDQALDQVFGGDSGVQAGDAGAEGDEGGEGGEGAVPEEEVPATAAARLDEALGAAASALGEADAALQSGDWAAYGAAQTALEEAIVEATRAQEEIAAATGQAVEGGVTPTPLAPSDSPNEAGDAGSAQDLGDPAEGVDTDAPDAAREEDTA